MRQDYIRFARARGLKDRAIHFRHALKNTLVPVITVTGLQLGSIIAFAIITEDGVSNGRGWGSLFINAIQFVDIPVMAAYLMLISVMFVAINLIVDLLYVAIDPRLRTDGEGRMTDQPNTVQAERARSRIALAWESDISYAFRHSPVAMVFRRRDADPDPVGGLRAAHRAP